MKSVEAFLVRCRDHGAVAGRDSLLEYIQSHDTDTYAGYNDPKKSMKCIS
jgi:hypothetical protein